MELSQGASFSPEPYFEALQLVSYRLSLECCITLGIPTLRDTSRVTVEITLDYTKPVSLLNTAASLSLVTYFK